MPKGQIGRCMAEASLPLALHSHCMQMLLVCYFNGSLGFRLIGLGLMLLLLLPFFLVLLSDISDAFVSPTMGLLSQSIPYLSPRLAGVTLLAIGNGAPDLSSNSHAIASGAVHLSAGALTGAAMFVQCIVGSEVIRLSEGVAISPSQIRDMIIYILSIAGVLLFFTIGQFTFIFVAFAIIIYSSFVLNVALGGFSVPFLFPSLWGQKRVVVVREEDEPLLDESDECEAGERVARAETVRFNWAQYRDQILQLQQENRDEESFIDQEADHPLDKVPEEREGEEEEEGIVASFASFTEEPDWAPASSPAPLSPPARIAVASSILTPSPARRKHLSFFQHQVPPISIPPASLDHQEDGNTSRGLKRNKTIGNQVDESKVTAYSKLIDTRAYKFAVLADHVSADPFHLDHTVAPLAHVSPDDEALVTGRRQKFLRNFSRIDTIGRARDLSSSGLGSPSRRGLLRASSSRLQMFDSSIYSRSRSIASRVTRSSSSRLAHVQPYSSLDSPSGLGVDSPRVITLPSRLSRMIEAQQPQTPTVEESSDPHPLPSPSLIPTTPLPTTLPTTLPTAEDYVSMRDDEGPSYVSLLSSYWDSFLHILDMTLLEVTAGSSDEWEDGSGLIRTVRTCFLPLLLPCYLILRLTMPLIDPHSYRKEWLLLSIIGAPLAASAFLIPSPDGSLFGLGYILLISASVGTVLSLIASLTITRNKGSEVPTLLLLGVDLAPSLFSLVAFFIGLLFVNLVAGEVVGILTLLAAVLHIPPSIVGCTLLAWGNSLSDLAGNTSLALSGLSSMALTACTAGPLFNMLISMAIGFSSLLADGKSLSHQVVHKGDVTEEPGVIRVRLSADIVVACIFLIGLNLVQIITVLMRSKSSSSGHGLPKTFYRFSRVWYLSYLALAISAAMGLFDKLS